MDFFIGSVATLIIWAVAVRTMQKNHNATRKLHVSWSQTRSYELIKAAVDIVENGIPQKSLVTQATKLYDKKHIRVVIFNDNAYWIKDNVFYTASVIDGDVDQASAKIVDTMSMSKVELDTMAFIVDKLTEGIADDHRSSGNS